MTGQQIGDDGTFPAGVDNGGRTQCGGDIVRRWHMAEAAEATGFALTLIGDEEEGPVLDKGPTERAAELVVVERILRNGGAVEEVARVDSAVAKEFKCRTVELICSRLGYEVYDRSRVSAKLRIGPGDNRYLRESVERQKRRRGSPDARFVDGRIVAEAVIHIGAIQKVVVGAAAAAVDTEHAE